MKTNDQVALKVNEREIPSAPESPAYWNNSESSAWQSGWVSGYMAALASAPNEQDKVDATRYRFLRDAEMQTQNDGVYPRDGSMWVIKYKHPKGTIPEVVPAGSGKNLDIVIDAARTVAVMTAAGDQDK